MHAAPPTIWIVVVPTEMTVLLGLHNPPRVTGPVRWVPPYLASL
jgi:hypothetical protein